MQLQQPVGWSWTEMGWMDEELWTAGCSPALSETRSIPLGFSSKFSCLSHAPLLYAFLLTWWSCIALCRWCSQEHTWNGKTSVSPNRWKKKLKLGLTHAGHVCNLVCYYIQNRCGSTITCNHPDYCWFEKVVPWLFFQKWAAKAWISGVDSMFWIPEAGRKFPEALSQVLGL